MKALYQYILESQYQIVQEAFIDNVFGKFKKTQDIMNRINKAKVKIDSLAKSTKLNNCLFWKAKDNFFKT